MEDFQSLGYLRYNGELVTDGLMDLRKSADALSGFDQSLRYFLCQEDPIFNEIEFEIPVRIQKKCWEALIPDNIEMYLVTLVTLAAARYGSAALSEMAKRDFENIGFKDIFKAALKGMTWVIRIGAHVKSMRKIKFDNVKFQDNNEIILIPDENGTFLLVPKKYFDLYIRCPEHLFSKIVKHVELERELEIGLTDDLETNIKINKSQKDIFYKSDDNDDIVIFPELKHDEYIQLEGYVTRGNQSTNSIGFQYQDHILTCYPLEGSIVDYKTELFSHCIIKGYIDREDKLGHLIEKKPRINFTELTIKPAEQVKGLFD
jgi:hypothetical protein